MMVYFAHANSTNKNSDRAVSGRKCRNEMLDKICNRFYSVDAPVCFRLFRKWRPQGKDVLLVNTLMYAYLSLVLFLP